MGIVEASEDDSGIIGVRVTPARRLAFFLTVDTLFVVASIALALVLRWDGLPPRTQLQALPFVAAATTIATLATLYALGVYRLSWAFMGLRDIARVAIAVTIATGAMGVAVQATHWLPDFSPFPRSVVLIQAPITFCALAGFRLSKRAVRLARGKRDAARHGARTLLVGAGEAGEQVLKSIQSTGAPYDVRGFVDDDPLARGTLIHGVRVLGPVAQLEEHVKRHRVETVIICTASASSRFVQTVVHKAKAANVPNVRIIPSLSEIVDGNVSIGTTREVKLEDLLGRDAIKTNPEEVRAFLAGKRVLVTGGAGTIGSELCRQIARFAPSRLVILDVDETRLHDIAVDLQQVHANLIVGQALVDVRDARAVRELFQAERPEIVFHAAAYKHVPMMEMYPLAALDANPLGTANTVDAAEAVGTERFILISTDKAVEPSSVMGASKRLAEMVLFGIPAKSRMIRSAVRFGNVIGSRGSVIPTFERQIKQGGPLTVTHPDMTRFFMMTSEAVSLVLQAASMGEGRDVFVLDMGKPVRILDVAREFIRLHGHEPDGDIRIRFTGLRPGEKLFEVLTYPQERPLPTRHPRVTRVDAGELATPPQLLDTIRGLVEDRNPAAAHAYLRHLFPTIAEAAEAAKAASAPPAAPQRAPTAKR